MRNRIELDHKEHIRRSKFALGDSKSINSYTCDDNDMTEDDRSTMKLNFRR